MDERRFLEGVTEGPWTGVRLLGRPAPGLWGRSMRLCEAVAESFNRPVVLSSSQLACPGARRSLGMDENDEDLARQMSEKAGMPVRFARQIIAERPRLEWAPQALALGNIEGPDALVGYLEPLAAMKVLRLWQAHFGTSLHVELSGFLAVCSCIAAAVRLGRLCLSLGCPDSREYGAIPPTQLVAVLPIGLAGELAQRSKDHAHV